MKFTGRNLDQDLARRNETFQHIDDSGPNSGKFGSGGGLHPSAVNMPASGKFGNRDSSGSEGISREIFDEEADVESGQRSSHNRDDIHGGSDSEAARYDENLRESVLTPALTTQHHESKSKDLI